ncbi:ABC transporter permease subunit [Entomospira nematocerorum]|uniref:ABC transporter permease subunit n=1 Tax=Entomospira nematocerorum TaxID=2719987 RepID=A0A968KY31_9SPIO|nr:ABC transporter permease subunit [Entomospira nematocera]NIZ47147.1 ABC transporter permease subunit [Entomospira nematocera]WDI34310.1 ABC transporter permease subunit [Entomospira nematocera]
MRYNIHIVQYIFVVMLYILCLFLWQWFASYFPSWSTIFPPPLTIWQSMLGHRVLLLYATWQTMWQAIVGLVLGSLIAIILGLILYPLPLLRRVVYPLMYAWQSTPTIATTTLVLLWFGFGAMSQIILIILATFFPIYVAFYQALIAIDPKWVNLLKSYGAKWWQVFSIIRWPFALVGFFAGLKIATTYLISVTITAQWLAGQDGLGNLLLRSRKSYDYPLMMATVSISIGLSLGLMLIMDWLERMIQRKYQLSHKRK